MEFPVAREEPKVRKKKGSKKPYIEQGRCQKCGLCWTMCPEGAIYQTASGSYDIDYRFCSGCLICTTVCAFKAIGSSEVK
ncbi:MAG: 4Fe-4S binding protein [Candidatus Nanoarchaeia archaeon]|nr:4Fe-4S binding protein [Candidatus Haiyanarchaeum thermophilum]MCW1303191.1 4Fe-4S binding protein [Candidatus Haiyanarchaeum thermophilum]MCW1303857.1 4Fe-4S binding protein [Candidatus Haiyanarchaeum thermophilum]MCW1306527.1 4Fe-4S binding protein [Candidatus Haiyanarchaeum thermophilum]MCW1306940.1 4Fe-4S binding protein [Candidatus Haiyanarchaeum thermophilum]